MCGVVLEISFVISSGDLFCISNIFFITRFEICCTRFGGSICDDLFFYVGIHVLQSDLKHSVLVVLSGHVQAGVASLLRALEGSATANMS